MRGTILQSREKLGLAPGEVVLSFDDGPVPEQSSRLLSVLEREEVVAALCLVGVRLAGQEAFLQRATRSGQIIVNHGYLHRAPQFLKKAEFLADVEQFDESVAGCIGVQEWTSTFFRPPGGSWGKTLASWVGESGRRLMPITFFAWDIIPGMIRESRLLGACKKHLHQNRGGLLLLHEASVPITGEKSPVPPRADRPWLPDMVQRLIRETKSDGFRFVSPNKVSNQFTK